MYFHSRNRNKSLPQNYTQNELWFIIIVITATGRSGDDAGEQRPTNTIAIVGSTVTLPCTSRVNNESRWYFYACGATKPNYKIIYNGNDVIGRHVTVDFNSCRLKTCHLTIESAQLEDAGYYICFELSSSSRKAASLVVLGRL